MGKEHTHKVALEWKGNLGQGTLDYRSYSRDLVVTGEGKPEIPGSSDPNFRGDPKRWNPEELLLASLSSCHMLWYLHLCSVHKITVVDYRDAPTATMEVELNGDGKITKATLYPIVTILQEDKKEQAILLHEEAHHKCFVAKAINFPISISPTVQI